jgi:hypothetical protein
VPSGRVGRSPGEKRGAAVFGLRLVRRVVFGDQRGGVDAHDAGDGADVAAGVEVTAAQGVIIELDVPDDPLADPGLTADFADAEPGSAPCVAQHLAYAHRTPSDATGIHTSVTYRASVVIAHDDREQRVSGNGSSVDFRAAQRLVWQNKLAKGFGTTDVPLEFCLLQSEVAEAFEAWHKDGGNLGEELADVALYTLGLAEMTGVDLQAAVEAKLVKNAARQYRRLPRGAFVKEETAEE